MKKIANIAFAPEHGFRGEADLFLPDQPEQALCVLLVHGGGWNAMDRTALYPIARLLVNQGFAVFSHNYRLLSDVPWPACGDDCLAAANYLLNARHPEMARLNLDKIIVAGGSAGGHLAMMTGFRLPSSQVSAIISMAGPSDLAVPFTENKDLATIVPLFFGRETVTETDIRQASPVNYITSDSPSLHCIHSVNDRLVLPCQSVLAVEKCRSLGVNAQLAEFDGPGKAHGFWLDGEPDFSKRKFFPAFEEELRSVMREFGR